MQKKSGGSIANYGGCIANEKPSLMRHGTHGTRQYAIEWVQENTLVRVRSGEGIQEVGSYGGPRMIVPDKMKTIGWRQPGRLSLEGLKEKGAAPNH